MLYVLACQEVESACKAVLEANGATPVARHFNINDYSRLARPLRLVEWTVNLSADPTYGLITPFGEWAPGRGGQLKWYADHHEVKHSREKNLKLATLENTIEALAAVYVLRQAQFGSFDGEIGFARDEFEVSLVAPIWDDAEGYIPPSTLGLDGAQPLERLWVAQPYPNL